MKLLSNVSGGSGSSSDPDAESLESCACGSGDGGWGKDGGRAAFSDWREMLRIENNDQIQVSKAPLTPTSKRGNK